MIFRLWRISSILHRNLRVRVSFVRDRDFEIVVLISEIRHGLPYIVGHTAPPEGRACESQVDRVLSADCSDTFRPVDPYPVSRQEVVDFLEGARKHLEEIPYLLLEIVRQVERQSADPRIGSREPRSAYGLEYIVDPLPFLKAVEECAHRAKVERVSPYSYEVGLYPAELE